MTPVDAFVTPNECASQQLKMERTRFVNPHALTTTFGPDAVFDCGRHGASDALRLNKASFRFYVSQKERQISFDRGGHRLNYVLRSTNELLGRKALTE